MRLTEESEHASARLHLYCCSWRDKDDGWMDAEAQLLLRAHFSFCQLSLLLGTRSAVCIHRPLPLASIAARR